MTKNKKMTFGIQATAAAFETLSSRLYSDPILAVIRELSTNANDAHIQAGYNDPFDLHIPTKEEPYFRIRDYGTGIEEDLIYEIYTTFFMSTKTEDEEQTGYFGLGSKAPFALTDQYTVISYTDGVKKTYLMKKESTGPVVEKTKEEPTTEHNGLEIRFSYDKDFYAFKSRAYDFFKGTSFLPNINIPEVISESYADYRAFYTNDSILFQGVENNLNLDNYLSVNVAGVKFGLSYGSVSSQLPEVLEMCKKAYIKGINIMAGKSSVTITPSREELHFDEKTINFIKTKTKEVVDAYFDEVLNNLDDVTYTKSKTLINQSYDNAVREYFCNKNKTLFFNRNFVCYHSGNGYKIKNYSPVTSENSYYCSSKSKRFLIDFSGIKSAVKQKVVDNFLNEKVFDDSGKITSTSFTSVMKIIMSCWGCDSAYFVFPSKGAFKELEKYLGDDKVVIRWADYCDRKKESDGDKRKVGFITKPTKVADACHYSGQFTSCGYRYSNSPDLEDDEIGLIIQEEKEPFFKYNAFLRTLKMFKKDYKVAIRPCKESVYKRLLRDGYKDAQTFIDELVSENASSLNDQIEKRLKYNFLDSSLCPTGGYQERFAKLICDKKYDPLAEKEPWFETLRKLYNEKTFEEGTPIDISDFYSTTLCKEIEKKLALPENPIKNFEKYPMFEFIDSYKLYIHSNSFETKTNAAFDYMLNTVMSSKTIVETAEEVA